MRIMLEEDLAHCDSLDAVQTQLQETLRYFMDEGFDVSYVAGPISADGEDKIPENIHRLISARGLVVHLNRDNGIKEASFTAPFVFTPEIYQKLGLFKMDRDAREALMQKFWDDLILSGLIKVIYFTPGWVRSPGARKERETAQQSGVDCLDLVLD